MNSRELAALASAIGISAVTAYLVPQAVDYDNSRDAKLEKRIETEFSIPKNDHLFLVSRKHLQTVRLDYRGLLNNEGIELYVNSELVPLKLNEPYRTNNGIEITPIRFMTKDKDPNATLTVRVEGYSGLEIF